MLQQIKNGYFYIIFKQKGPNHLKNILLFVSNLNILLNNFYIHLSIFVFRDEPVCVYTKFKEFMTRFCVELFLNLDSFEFIDLIEEIQSLATTHWHGKLYTLWTLAHSIHPSFNFGQTTILRTDKKLRF